MGSVLRAMVAHHRLGRRTLTATAAIAAIAICSAYYLVDPADSGIYPRCLFRQLSGYDCPGCGSQRAIHSLLHGDLAAAWDYNALLLIEIPLMALLTAAWMLRHRYPAFHHNLNSRAVILLILASIIAWTIIRNLG